MKAEDVIEFYETVSKKGIDIWLDGGWAVDALLGEQTRPREDVDIVIQQKDVLELRRLLESRGYHDVIRDDTRAWNFVLGDNKGHVIDIHVITFDRNGNGLYGSEQKGLMYPAASLTGIGRVGKLSVRCISAEYLVKFHTGYKLDENDFKDISALCGRFAIVLPREYIKFKKIKEK
jgi:lincosamide nucleotidyltransferase A/C/D/E